MMVDVDDAVIARFKAGGTNLEILVDCDKALEFRKGAKIDINDILASDKVFFDAKKGQLASETKIREIFATDDIAKIATEIIKKGEVQLTTEWKRKLHEEKKKRIMQMLHANAIDPKTGNPHPPTRLELAMDEAKIKIDEHKSEEQQVQEIVKKLQPILPIKIEKRDMQIVIPAQFAGKAFSTVKEMCRIKNETWRSDGSLQCVVEIPAGLRSTLIDRLNGLTKGEVQTKILGE